MDIKVLCGLLVALAGALSMALDRFCAQAKEKLGSVKVAGPVASMAPTVPTVPTVPKESAGGAAPSLPAGVSTGVVSPPEGYWFGQRIGHISATACAQSGQSIPDPRPKHAGDTLTVVGVASHNAEWLVCMVGKRAKLRSLKELGFTSTVNPVSKPSTSDAVLNTLVTHPSALELPASAIVQTPQVTPAQPATSTPSALDRRIATLFDALVSTGLPRTIASLQARSMAEQEALDAAKASPAAPAPTHIATVSPASPGSKAVKGQLYPLAIPSGATRLVFWNKDGTPMNNTSGAQHSMSANGSSGQALARGEHRLSARIASGDIRVEYR